MTEQKDEWEFTDHGYRCPCCNEKGNVFVRTKESYDGGHEDYQYWCKRCGCKYWVDGIDS